MEKLLTVQDVTALVRLSYPSLYRLMKIGQFPQPLARGRKLLWTQVAITEWVNRQSTPIPIPTVTSPTKVQKQQDKDYLQRQEAARQALERHRKKNDNNEKRTQNVLPDDSASNNSNVGKKGLVFTMSIIFILFLSQSLMVGALRNTAFAVTPTEVTEANAEEVFRCDHTPILFEDGHCKGENFVYATCIPFDIDNSHSDNPADWVTADDIEEQLGKMGIKHWIAASRNHLLSKEGKAPRPKFHVYLPLLEPLHDSDKFVRYCKWCIKTFNADVKVKSKAQKLFGYGDNPNAFVMVWNEGQYIDEILTDEDIADNTVPVVPVTRKAPVRSSKMSNSPFDRFIESGEWKNHLADLEELGWRFIEKGDELYFQTPDGDHSPGKQDGNIKNGVAYFFSKAPSPFENDKGYSIPRLFAGAVFGNIGKRGIALFASRYIHDAPVNIPRVSCGVEKLDVILSQIVPVDWEPYYTVGKDGKVIPPSEKVYVLRTIERILETANATGTPMVIMREQAYYFTETYYRMIVNSELQNFLIGAALRCGVPNDIAVYQSFVEKSMKQFYIDIGRVSNAVEPDTDFINLRNGTVLFDKTGHRFERHTSELFIRYVLDFDYDESATAPRWQQHIDRSLPNPEKQMYLAKCLALPFYKGKIEKAPILYGKRDTGKSTTLDVYKALIGDENMSTEVLDALTRTDSSGGFSRARLDGKLINIGSDVSPKIADEGMAKTLISREAVSAAFKHKDSFNMRYYARLIFAMNDLPPQFVSEDPLRKRAAIIEFDQQLKPDEIITGFTEWIIENELPGVLNWIIVGLKELNSTGRLDPPQCCIDAMVRIRKEVDPISGWLEDQQIYVGNSEKILLKDAYGGRGSLGDYTGFIRYCMDNGHRVPSKPKFVKRLENMGFDVSRTNNHTGKFLHYTNTSPENDALHAPDAPPLETQGETGAESGREPGVKAGMVDLVGNPTIPGCSKCVYHRPETYSTRGLCDAGYCQQDLRCCDYAPDDSRDAV